MVRALWAMFVASVFAVGYLSVSEISEDPESGRGEEPAPSEAPPLAGTTPSGGITATEAELQSGPERQDIPVRAANPLADAAAAGSEETNEEETPEANGELEDPLETAAAPAPEEFMEHLVALALKGDLEELTKHLSPGMVRLTRGLLPLILAKKAGVTGEKLDRIFDELSFEFEEMGDGLVRVFVDGPEGQPPEGIYLIPDEGSWKLVAESDLPGPLAELRHALNHLQLLALCQYSFVTDDLGGGGAYAETVRELADGLNRSPVYEDALPPDFARAVDAGSGYGSYNYGRIESGPGGFGYYATPTFGSELQETLLIDSEGHVWGKDLQGAPPPSTWPGPDLAREGWKRRRGTWR